MDMSKGEVGNRQRNEERDGENKRVREMEQSKIHFKREREGNKKLCEKTRE